MIHLPQIYLNLIILVFANPPSGLSRIITVQPHIEV